MSENPVPVEDKLVALDFTGVRVTGLSGTGIASINGDSTPAQVLAGTGGINVIPGPPGTLTIGISSSQFLTSINGDFNTAQMLQPEPIPGGSNTIVINDVGGGVHQIGVVGFFATVATPGGSPVNVPAGLPQTTVLTLSVPSPGKWFFTANVNGSPIPGTINILCRLLNGVSAIGESICETTIGASLNNFGLSVTSYVLNLLGGENIDLIMQQDSAGSINANATLDGVRLGD